MGEAIWTPDVRSLAVSADGTIYANIHVGWVVRSRDGGKTWENLREGLEMDVHQVATHPSDPATVFAATARGFYLSRDHGDTFTHQRSGMPYYYQRACACFPESDVYLVSTSRGPHSRVDAQLYRSDDAGENWALVTGLPEQIGENIDTFQIITVGGANALVVVDDTILYQTDDCGLNVAKGSRLSEIVRRARRTNAASGLRFWFLRTRIYRIVRISYGRKQGDLCNRTKFRLGEIRQFCLFS